MATAHGSPQTMRPPQSMGSLQLVGPPQFMDSPHPTGFAQPPEPMGSAQLAGRGRLWAGRCGRHGPWMGSLGPVRSEEMVLTWWPLFRDCTYYIFGLILLASFASDGQIVLAEAIVLFVCYLIYCVIMYHNQRIEGPPSGLRRGPLGTESAWLLNVAVVPGAKEVPGAHPRWMSSSCLQAPEAWRAVFGEPYRGNPAVSAKGAPTSEVFLPMA